MNKIYTKSGDNGVTTTASGKCVEKNSPCIELVGTIDEASAFLGIAGLLANEELKKDIEFIRIKLSFLMGKISMEECIEKEEISKLEDMCKSYSDEEIFSFEALDKTPISAHLNYARTIIRRAERVACDMCDKKGEEQNIIAYLNRLGDLLFAMARKENKE